MHEVRIRGFLDPLQKEKNSLWILLLGASAMEGMGSNKNGKWFDITNVSDHTYEETISAYLTDLLQKKYPEIRERSGY